MKRGKIMIQQEKLEILIERFMKLNEENKDYVRELVKGLAGLHCDWKQILAKDRIILIK
jgi:hypothetical protein